jgi:hypothetical protein
LWGDKIIGSAQVDAESRGSEKKDMDQPDELAVLPHEMSLVIVGIFAT